MNWQNFAIACEWTLIAFPRTLFSSLSPNTSFAANTAGVNGPNLAFFPIVQRAGADRVEHFEVNLFFDDSRTGAPVVTNVIDMMNKVDVEWMMKMLEISDCLSRMECGFYAK